MLRCVDACVERIIRQPESYPVVHRGTRMALVRRFPFLILYRISGQNLTVIAVFHAKRDPKIWQAR
ncbi:MAG: type II toxin-antitoxin system RelE/ParE family toxin [Verrucomicrobiae bacterium]|nr:type II toxin-antitoxin system RelE/ParE family toxin [Verrucomicrobiae bacterium]